MTHLRAKAITKPKLFDMKLHLKSITLPLRSPLPMQGSTSKLSVLFPSSGMDTCIRRHERVLEKFVAKIGLTETQDIL